MVDLTKVTVTSGTLPERTTGKPKRDLGPNVFLDKSWAGNLQASYDDASAFSLTVPGKYVEGKVETGKNVGRKVLRLTGDAADAISLIRQAAEHLELGVAVFPPIMVEATPENAKKLQRAIPKPGQITITYQGQTRKVQSMDVYAWGRENGWTVDDTKTVPPRALRKAYDKAMASK